MKMKCLICQKRTAVKIEPYGWLPCKFCRDKQKRIDKLKQPVEMTTQIVKEERIKYSDDILQPFRDGTVSKEYISKYGSERINATPDEIKNARNVWDDVNYYKKE